MFTYQILYKKNLLSKRIRIFRSPQSLKSTLQSLKSTLQSLLLIEIPSKIEGIHLLSSSIMNYRQEIFLTVKFIYDENFYK